MTPVFFEIKNSIVGIAGMGGLGSNVAVALTRLGLGKLIIADFDLVENSNLNRQQYYLDQVGQPKVDASTDNLKRINPHIDIQAHRIRLTAANIPEIFAKADVIAECFDRSEPNSWVGAIVLAPWISGSKLLR